VARTKVRGDVVSQLLLLHPNCRPSAAALLLLLLLPLPLLPPPLLPPHCYGCIAQLLLRRPACQEHRRLDVL